MTTPFDKGDPRRPFAEQMAQEVGAALLSGEHLLTIVDLIPVTLFVKDANSRILLMNRACEEAWGIAFADIRGTDGSQHFPAERVAAYLAKDREVFAGGVPVDFDEVFWSAAHGENRYGYTYKRPIYDAAGKPLYLVCVTVDITERRRYRNALHDSETRLRESILNSPIPNLMHAEDGSVLMISKAWTDITGYRLEDIPTIDDWVEKAFGADDIHARRRIKALFDLAAVRKEGEYKVRTASGETRLWEFQSQPLPRLPDGRRVVLSLAIDITERRRMEADLKELAITDPLTGLPNRRHFMAALERELARVKRFRSQPAALLMIDLDDFKKINDRHGHACGDAVLVHFARLVRESLRSTDTAGRMGGEEFALLLPGADLDTAKEFAERLRHRVVRLPTAHDGAVIPVTASIGVSVLDPDDPRAEAVMARADAAAYRAKEAGCNRVEG